MGAGEGAGSGGSGGGAADCAGGASGHAAAGVQVDEGGDGGDPACRSDQGEEGAGRGGGDSESGKDDAVVLDHDTQSVGDRMEAGEGGDGEACGGAGAMRITCLSGSWLELARR